MVICNERATPYTTTISLAPRPVTKNTKCHNTQSSRASCYCLPSFALPSDNKFYHWWSSWKIIGQSISDQEIQDLWSNAPLTALSNPTAECIWHGSRYLNCCHLSLNSGSQHVWRFHLISLSRRQDGFLTYPIPNELTDFMPLCAVSKSNLVRTLTGPHCERTTPDVTRRYWLVSHHVLLVRGTES